MIRKVIFRKKLSVNFTFSRKIPDSFYLVYMKLTRSRYNTMEMFRLTIIITLR